MKNIIDRCNRLGPQSDWCKCLDNDLDEYTCGYTLGSSYHVGNGGTIVVELRTNAMDGRPTNVVLGKTKPFVPMDNKRTSYPALEFLSPVKIEAGRIYHLVFTNLTPPTKCTALVRIKPSEAKNCPKNQGAQGLNGPRLLSIPSKTGLRGPYLGDLAGANYFRRTKSSGWSFYKTNLSWYEVGYIDGVYVGDSYTPLDSISTAEHNIGGKIKARQIFTVQDATRKVDGLWLNFGYQKSSDGSAVSIILKDNTGKALATGKIDSSDYCLKTIKENKVTLAHWCEDWGYTSFGKTINLLKGSTYYVEVSANTGAGIKLAAYESLSFVGFKDRNNWVKAHAQLSKNNGASWGDWAVVRPKERDLALLFTIDGMPRQLK